MSGAERSKPAGPAPAGCDVLVRGPKGETEGIRGTPAVIVAFLKRGPDGSIETACTAHATNYEQFLALFRVIAKHGIEKGVRVERLLEQVEAERPAPKIDVVTR